MTFSAPVPLSRGRISNIVGGALFHKGKRAGRQDAIPNRPGREHYNLLGKMRDSLKESSQAAFRSFLGLLSPLAHFLQMFSASLRSR